MFFQMLKIYLKKDKIQLNRVYPLAYELKSF